MDIYSLKTKDVVEEIEKQTLTRERKNALIVKFKYLAQSMNCMDALYKGFNCIENIEYHVKMMSPSHYGQILYYGVILEITYFYPLFREMIGEKIIEELRESIIRESEKKQAREDIYDIMDSVFGNINLQNIRRREERKRKIFLRMDSIYEDQVKL